MSRRIGRLKEKLERTRLDAAIITSWENLYYLTGIMTMQSRSKVEDPMPLLVTSEGHVIFFPTVAFHSAVLLEHQWITDARACDVHDIWVKISRALQELRLTHGNVGLEFRYLSKYHSDQFRMQNPEVNVHDCSGILEELRMTKESEEISRMKEACRITDKTLELAASDLVRPGRSEMEVAGEIVRLAVDFGAEGPSFHPQVVSGRRSSLLNISSSYEKRIEKGDIVLLDFGIRYKGYCSDTARAFVLGNADERQKEIVQAVLQILQAALSIVRDGVKASDIHKQALTRFKELGFEGWCRHSSGHGIGLAVWEKPLLREFDHTVLEENTTLAVEQGLYLDNFGIRFEQNLRVTRNGYEPFFEHPMELVSI